jgi:prepilin-type processing-associated H-X9-DG protein
MVATEIPSDYNSTAITNYSVSPFIFSSEYNNGRGWRVTPARLRRPSEQILLGDGLPRAKDSPYGFTMVIYWDLLNSGRAGNSGNPPVSNPGRADRVINWPDGIEDMTDDGGKGLPAFRNRGKGHFLFADGHVEAMSPNDLKYKHFAISY